MITQHTREGTTPWRVVGYFTDKYKGEAEQMVESMQPFDFSYSIASVYDMGSWEKNTHLKPDFIAHCLNYYDEDIVYIDVDARVERFPELFNKLSNEYIADIGFHLLNDTEFLSGTLFFKNNDMARQVVDKWVERCQSAQHINEQTKLGEIVRSIPELRVSRLPVEYCAIFDHPSAEGKEKVITHYQASRRTRR